MDYHGGAATYLSSVRLNRSNARLAADTTQAVAALCMKLSPLPIFRFLSRVLSHTLLFRPRSASRITYAPYVIAQCDCKCIYRSGRMQRPRSERASARRRSGGGDQPEVYIFAGISVSEFRIICFDCRRGFRPRINTGWCAPMLAIP